MNRFRSFFAVLQIFHLPFTYLWPSGAFVYWISSSTFVAIQATITKRPWFLSKVNPHFFYDYARMYQQRPSHDHENYVDRFLHAEDNRLKQMTTNRYVADDLERELKNFVNYSRAKKIKDTAKTAKETGAQAIEQVKAAKQAN
jgi:hypothetical protein